MKIDSYKYHRALIVLVFLLLLTINGYAQERSVINSSDELPRFTYKINSTVSELISSEAEFNKFKTKIRSNIKQILDNYTIKDKYSLQKLYNTLIYLDILDGKYQEALGNIINFTGLEEKPANRLLACIFEESLIRTCSQITDKSSYMFKTEFSKIYQTALKALPWDTIQLQIQSQFGAINLLSEGAVYGKIKSVYDPIVENLGHISENMAYQLIQTNYQLSVLIPLKNQIVQSLEEYVNSNIITKKNIWPDREVDIRNRSNLKPVFVAIWDMGLDPSIFPNQIWTNPREELDNIDNDQNGFVDDIYGISFGYNQKYQRNPLISLPAEIYNNYSEYLDDVKGTFDIFSNIDSPEAEIFQKKLSTISPDNYKSFRELINLLYLYVHGTHIAGIAVDGNPYAKLVNCRIYVDHRLIPLPPTEELVEKQAKNVKRACKYFKENGIRIVNVGWMPSRRALEYSMEANGIIKNARDRANLAMELYTMLINNMYYAIKDASNILFIVPAGNSNIDVSKDHTFKDILTLPNVLTVGAVDKAGDETTFTSFGKNVDIYANGANVESTVPGGKILQLSGTGVATPHVTNLAAKLLVVNPRLSSEELIDLIKLGADRSDDGRRLLLNPRTTFQLLEVKMNRYKAQFEE